ncbi:type 1 glutamine amidotransferase [Aestuariispira insulae]|uniref:GMP synthase-like glutamine amidotransferase n=1 Tax=Aestuariispira insulae TaxID=1461337 RepID=A0A3D9H6H9_9PROT|nr:hypothetical protein [Aestuariispira insulae]RED45115.1 GMP synthase-like glutamine amidotransferase [Aestuariispira insulae]
MAKNRILFISQIAEPGRYPDHRYADAPGGDNEVHWVSLKLDEAGVLNHIDYDGLHACRGDGLPGPEDADGVILGGSYHSVHEKRPFQLSLLDWLDNWWDSGKPLMGICGGHQLMAVSRGGDVIPVEGGPMAASLPVDITDAGRDHYLFDGLGAAPEFHFGNYEQVAAPVDDAVVLATRPEMAAMALDYGHHRLSVQFHPEADCQVFAGAWSDNHPEYVANYHELPDAPKMLRNFLKGSGLI